MTSHQAWGTWSFHPVVVVGLAVTAWSYAAGVRSLWGGGHAGRGVRPWQAAAFGAGLLAVAAALLSPIDAVADSLLSVHMGQHLLLMVVAGPLLVLGSPALAMSPVVPDGWRHRAHAWGGRGATRLIRRWLTHPVTSWVVVTATVWAWHAPSLYQAAVRDPTLHLAEHASFLAAAILFWWVAFQPSGPRRLARGADVLYVCAGALQSGALGALMVFASTPIYPLYAARTAAWGLSPVSDQQMAGLLMWVPSFLIYLLAAAGLFVGWLHAVDRDTRRSEIRSDHVASLPPGLEGGV
jgi:cytochrome c oxidase assembly factor CtaG